MPKQTQIVGEASRLVPDVNKYLECIKQIMSEWDSTRPEPKVTPPCTYPNPQTNDSTECEIWASLRQIKAGVASAQCGKYYDPNAPGQRFPPFPLPSPPPTKFPL